ncbi:MAG TPA: amidohydrolase family protein [Candidatus Polarisedimenticolia bacterium]|nr:amidohydrolase family protein [Candidatus Polarisedimenticolia bacterium]
MSSAADAEDAELAAFIARIPAVDNHAHANTVVPDDSEADALALEKLPEFSFPARLRPDNPEWIAAYRSLYGYPHADLAAPHLAKLQEKMRRIASEKGEKFPEWVLDRVGIDVMLANRVAMGPGLAAPRFRWVSYVDALMMPLSTKTEAAATPDTLVLYPSEAQLLRRYLAELHVEKLPATLEEYLSTVVVPTLEHQKQAGCVAVKFEAALLRPLDFADVAKESASRVYSQYAAGGEPSHAEYKALQDFLFRAIAREAGRLGMAVHIHSFQGPGGYYRVAGSDPLLLEPALNDPSLRGTNFVIVHGGGMYASHAGAMLWKPNVYVDTSGMALIYSPATLAGVLREWLLLHPEKVLFGTDAFATGPDSGWELASWLGTISARRALGIALTGMMRNGEVTRLRAQQIARMVMQENAVKLYHLSPE